MPVEQIPEKEIHMAGLIEVLRERDSLKRKWTKRELVVRRAIAQAKQQWLCKVLDGRDLKLPQAGNEQVQAG